MLLLLFFKKAVFRIVLLIEFNNCQDYGQAHPGFCE